VKLSASKPPDVIVVVVNVSWQGRAQSIPPIRMTGVGLERYWHWVIGYWAIFADIG